MTKRIVLCADDYGQAPAISQGIRYLILHGRLTATSCLVNTEFWPEHAKWLIPYKEQVDIGLHFNLTQGKALSKEFIRAHGEDFPSLPLIMYKAFRKQLNLGAIKAELTAQIDRFYEAIGFLPQFIDGHQHVHQFPVIRTALFQVYEERLQDHQPYIRLVKGKTEKTDFLKAFKKWLINKSGTKALAQLLNQYKIPHNQSFAGIYSFSKADQYRSIFLQFLQEIGDKGVIMCHPALNSAAPEDKIASARYAEYQYFTGGDFLLDCLDHGITLRRFTEKESKTSDSR